MRILKITLQLTGPFWRWRDQSDRVRREGLSSGWLPSIPRPQRCGGRSGFQRSRRRLPLMATWFCDDGRTGAWRTSAPLPLPFLSLFLKNLFAGCPVLQMRVSLRQRSTCNGHAKPTKAGGGGSRKVQDVVDEQMMTGYVDHSSAYDK